MNHIEALRTIAEYPVSAQDDMQAANMRKIAIEALERLRSTAEPALAEAERTAPEAIWLDLGAEEALNVRFGSLYEVTWSDDNASGTGIKYIRADRAARAQAPAAVEPVVQEPIHWRAVLDPEQVPRQVFFNQHRVLFLEKRHAESWISEQLDFKGWRYTLEPLYAAPTTKAEPAPYIDSTPHLSVGESSFEDWYQNYPPNSVGHKQIARDAYSAGMGDPLVIAKTAPAEALPTYTDDLELRYVEACEERDHLRETLKTQSLPTYAGDEQRHVICLCPECVSAAPADALDAKALLIALQRAHDWMDSQADAQSKGCHSTFDLMMLREERDAAAAAIAAQAAQQGE